MKNNIWISWSMLMVAMLLYRQREMLSAWQITQLEKEHGDLHNIIPDMINQHGQFKTRERLGVSSRAIFRWLHENGYKTIYVKGFEIDDEGNMYEK